MDEQLLYIENCLPGIWSNDDYSFSFQLGTPNLATITDKQKAPNTGSGCQYHIVKQDLFYLLRLIIRDGAKVGVIDYKIDHIDCASGSLTISTDGATWILNKVLDY